MTIHLLVPIDGSAPSEAALTFALSEHPDAKITALHVVDPAELPGSTAIEAEVPERYDEYRLQQEGAADEILDDAAELADEYGVSIGTERMTGPVERSIVEFADGRDADRIVIGSHGRTGISRVFLGSIAETVARRAPVPVTIVR